MSDQKQHEEDYEALQKSWEEEVENNPRTHIFLEPYKKSDWKHLYKQYAFHKMIAYKHKELYRKHNEGQKNQWIDLARKHLEVIQQKKLFDAQCKWRAGQVVFENIQITHDFKVLQYNVMNCDFIEQPNSFDIDLYCEYLTQDGNAEFGDYGFHEWQDYEEFKDSYNTDGEGIDLPEWYEFHNNRTGNGILLTLPDVKGGLEQFYIELAHSDTRKNTETSTTINNSFSEEAHKPYLNYYDKNILLSLAKQIESKEMYTMFREFVEATEHKDSWENERARDCFEFLTDIKDELIPIEAHQDFRVALDLALKKYRGKKIAEHLPLALEMYRNNKRLEEIGINSYSEHENTIFYSQIRQMYAERILHGRKVNGEPQDFNY